MPQKGLKKEDGVRGRREKLSSKVFPFFPDHKSTFIGNRAKKNIPPTFAAGIFSTIRKADYFNSASMIIKSCFFNGKLILFPETFKAAPVSRFFADFTAPLQVSCAVISPV